LHLGGLAESSFVFPALSSLETVLFDV